MGPNDAVPTLYIPAIPDGELIFNAAPENIGLKPVCTNKPTGKLVSALPRFSTLNFVNTGSTI